MTRTLGDRQSLDRRVHEAIRRLEAQWTNVEIAQHARDRREEREAIDFGLIDLGEGG